MRRSKVTFALGSLAACSISMAAVAAPISVPNFSFETPVVPTGVPAAPLTNPATDKWSTFDPTPLDVGGGFFLNADDGVFPNEPVGEPDSFTNHHGNQLAYIGTEGGNAFFQLLTDTYASGQEYSLTVGVGRSFGSPPSANDALRMVLYYLDNGGNRQEISSVSATHTPGAPLSPTLLQDFTTTTPTLTAGHPAIGKQIGILLTTTGTVGGFFDMDNVRLNAVPEPGSVLTISAVAGLLALRRRKSNAALA